MKKPLLISFSGGRTSAYMTYLIMSGQASKQASKQASIEYEPHIVFANTGCEHEKTLEFVYNCEKHFGWDVTWLESKVHHGERKSSTYTEVDYHTASRLGEPYEQVIKKYGMPCVATPHCTRELKQHPIQAWCRDNFGKANILTALGIRADETRRVNSEKLEKELVWYPLVDLGVDKQEVLDFWADMPFDLGLPEHLGNCVWCFKKSDKKLLKALTQEPDYFEFPRRMEKIYPITKQGKDSRFFRGGRLVSDFDKLLLETGEPDARFIEDGGCSESCEFLV